MRRNQQAVFLHLRPTCTIFAISNQPRGVGAEKTKDKDVTMRYLPVPNLANLNSQEGRATGERPLDDRVCHILLHCFAMPPPIVASHSARCVHIHIRLGVGWLRCLSL